MAITSNFAGYTASHNGDFSGLVSLVFKKEDAIAHITTLPHDDGVTIVSIPIEVIKAIAAEYIRSNLNMKLEQATPEQLLKGVIK